MDSAGTWDLRLALGFSAGVRARQNWGAGSEATKPHFHEGMPGSTKRGGQEVFRQHTALPDTPAFHDEPADWFSTAA